MAYYRFLFLQILSLVLGCFCFPIYSQIAGCTDTQANNFHESAEINDGSCTYPFTSYSPDRLGLLPSEVPETSGLVLQGGCLWTHNDSGWKPNLFCLNPKDGGFIREVWVKNATNRDWEEITKDEEFLYVGDFGNNNGNRTDLRIYKIPLEMLSNDTVYAEVITFNYPDQTDFNSRPLDNNFDMEAMISMGDSLFLFSKNWVDLKTRLYALPKVAGDYTARLVDSMEVNGLITGSAYRDSDGLVVLVGYTPLLMPFAWLLWDYPEENFFQGNKRRVELAIPFHQVEAVAWDREADVFLISNERFSNVITIPAALHRLEVNHWVLNETTRANDLRNSTPGFHLFPNPAMGLLNISTNLSSDQITKVLVTNTNGIPLITITEGASASQFTIDISGLKSGIYWITVFSKKGYASQKFYKK